MHRALLLRSKILMKDSKDPTPTVVKEGRKSCKIIKASAD